MKALEDLLRDRGIHFHYKDNRIMCFPHIINICTSHVIESFTDIGLVDDQAGFDAKPLPCGATEQTYDEAVDRDPIALCRGTVRAIRASGVRRDFFDETVTHGNENRLFRSPENPEETIEVPKLQLLHNVKTRWDSVFKMISRFSDLRPVSNSQAFTYDHPHHNQIGYRPFPRFTS
jgi:hypothetical protein